MHINNSPLVFFISHAIFFKKALQSPSHISTHQSQFVSKFLVNMDFKLSLQLLFLLLASVAPHVISARDLHIRKSSRFSLPRQLLGSRKGHNIEGTHNVKTYLRRYGYLSSNVVETNDDNAFDDDLESAVKRYQKFFKLNVSGILDADTLHLMSQPRCSVPDVFDDKIVNATGSRRAIGTLYTFFPGEPKWSREKLKYAFINDFPSYFEEPVNQALKDWALYSPFEFTEVDHDAEADIRISFELGDHGDGHPFINGSGVLAHAFAPENGRLHFNSMMSWSNGAVDETFDVRSVAMHELGHNLGLGHSTSKQAIMFPTIPPATVKEINFDDIDGLNELYGNYLG